MAKRPKTQRKSTPGVRKKPRRSGVGAKRDASSALGNIEARFKAVLETAVDAIITINERGMILAVNPATERMFGYTAKELIDRNVNMLMPEPYCSDHDQYLARYLNTGERHIIGIGREVAARRKDGTVFAVDLAVSEVEPGKLFTGIIRDISDRKLAEARARETDRMASIGALAAGLGHDMNNVLLPVRAHLNALKSSSKGGQKSHVDRVEKGVKYLQQLADGLHYLAMNPDEDAEAEGCTQVDQWWAHTGALLSKAVPKHVQVTVDIAKGMPSVCVAAHALTQAVLNLIVNAGEAIEREQRGEVRVWAKAVGDGAAVQIGITDNGVGMSAETKRRAFDMFYTTKSRGLGTGLGLALVRRIVDRAGGTIELDTMPGRGTTFTLTLPAVVESEDDFAKVAVVSIADGRAAALVADLLALGGADVIVWGDPIEADIWVVQPDAVEIKDVRAWRAHHRDGTLIAFGRAKKNTMEWRALGAKVLRDPKNTTAIRNALEAATRT